MLLLFREDLTEGSRCEWYGEVDKLWNLVLRNQTFEIFNPVEKKPEFLTILQTVKSVCKLLMIYKIITEIAVPIYFNR